jgi:hypothetical protein
MINVDICIFIDLLLINLTSQVIRSKSDIVLLRKGISTKYNNRAFICYSERYTQVLYNYTFTSMNTYKRLILTKNILISYCKT